MSKTVTKRKVNGGLGSISFSDIGCITLVCTKCEFGVAYIAPHPKEQQWEKCHNCGHDTFTVERS